MIELVGNTLKYRILDPRGFTEFKSKDVGTHGKLSIIVGKKNDKWYVQSYRFSLPDYGSVTDVLHDTNTIKGVTQSDKDKIASLTRKYFKNING